MSRSVVNTTPQRGGCPRRVGKSRLRCEFLRESMTVRVANVGSGCTYVTLLLRLPKEWWYVRLSTSNDGTMSFIGYFVAISKEARLQPLRACQSMMRIAQSKEREMGGIATPPIRVRITSVKRGNVKKRQRKTRAKCEYRTLYLTSPGERVRIVFLVPIF